MSLLGTRRFLPLFAAQFFGAVNDNLFKNALVLLILYRFGGGAVLVPLAGGIFILPYALFSALAGQLADRLEKHRLVRLTKLYEVGLMTVGAAGLVLGSEALLLVVLFGLGVQATFFGPLKYGMLPELLAPGELLAGNGLIEASTFIGILVGTVAGGLLVLLPGGAVVAGCAALAVAGAGVLAAWFVPARPAASPELRLDLSIPRATAALLREARSQRTIWCAIVAISWFWALGAAFLAEFPTIVAGSFGATGQVVTLMLFCFSVGIGAGSLAASLLTGGRVTTRHAVPALLALSLFGADFCWVAHGVRPASGWHDVAGLMAHPRAWRLLFDLFCTAFAGGVFSVPLYALLQAQAAPAWRARMVAANNVMNAGMIVGGAAVLAGLGALHVPPAGSLALFCAVNLAVAAWLHRCSLP